MADTRVDRLESILLSLLPVDGGKVPNGQLRSKWVQAVATEGESVTEADFDSIRERMLTAGLLVKGPGRGGSTGRAAGAAPSSDDFELQAVDASADDPADKPMAPSRKAKTTPSPRSASDEAAQVISYRHADRRKNNPEVGLVSEASDPQQPKKVWAYNPHLDPVLNFDSSRAELENLVVDALTSGLDQDAQKHGEILAWLDHALAGSDASAMREVITNLRERLVKQKTERPERMALEEIQRRGAPYLQWAGKAERTSFEVDTVSLHVHERIDPMSILSAVRKGGPAEKNPQSADEAKLRQASLFEAPFENLPLRDAVDFYRHDKGWANRLISGDSLQVMNSLLVKEGMAGQVQMVYIDPPYGIKYGSNFQPFVGKREVKDKSDADLTQEPEMIKAFRDTWELGIHSYLTYLRDRLLVARELLSESGSVFVQISEENLHLIRSLLQEVFGEENFVSVVTVVKTSAQEADTLPNVCDYLVWYAKSKSQLKYRKLWLEKNDEDAGFSEYSRLELPDFRRRQMTAEELEGSKALPADAVRYRQDNIVSQRPPGNFPVPFQGTEYVPL